MLTDRITQEQLKIKVHHIGGIGDCGPTEAIAMLNGDVEWIVYDADKNALSNVTNSQNKNYTLINKCIGANNTKSKFHIMVGKSASSLYRPEPASLKYTLYGRKDHAQIWGEHTRITESVDVDTNTLDSIIENNEAPLIDFLSVDAQGADLDIIEGASNSLRNQIIGVLCEVEFTEIYEKQPLFGDIQKRLKKEGFRLCKIYNTQYWNVSPYPKDLLGAGFEIVGEALFLKNSNFDNLGPENSQVLVHSVSQNLKLAAIAVVFDQLDFALEIIDDLKKKKLISLDKLADRTDIKYIKLLRDLSEAADKIKKNNPPLIYESSNVLDRGDYKDYLPENTLHEPVINRLKKIILMITPPIIINMMVAVRNKIFKKNKVEYNSMIDRIYYQYGLTKLIKSQ